MSEIIFFTFITMVFCAFRIKMGVAYRNAGLGNPLFFICTSSTGCNRLDDDDQGYCYTDVVMISFM